MTVFQPIHQKIRQIQQYETTPINIDPPLPLSGLNSIVSTPKSSLSLSDINFIASPSAIYINNSSLTNISNTADDFFENLDREIEENRWSPKQYRNNILYVQAEISAATPMGTNILQQETQKIHNDIPSDIEYIKKKEFR